jgi:hypothetical protein
MRVTLRTRLVKQGSPSARSGRATLIMPWYMASVDVPPQRSLAFLTRTGALG